MIAATILPLVGADGDPERAVLLASALAILVGLLMLGAAAGRLGFVAQLLVQAHDRRLHERSRPDDPGRPDPQAARLLRRRRHLPRGVLGGRPGDRRRRGRRGLGGHRPVLAGPDPGPHPCRAEDPRGPGRRRDGHRPEPRPRPRGPGSLGGRRAAAGPADVHPPEGGAVGPRSAVRGCRRHHPRRPGRHHLHGHLVRGAPRRDGRRQPRDGRDRHGQHRRRACSRASR